MKKRIDKMSEENLEKISKELNSYDEFWNERILKDEFNNENSEYFVIYEDNEIYGFGGIWLNIDEAHIMNIAIKKDFRRNYLGYELLQYLMDYAKRIGKKCITLEVREDNIPAINLYKKLNFEEVGRRKKYYNNIYDALIMTKNF